MDDRMIQARLSRRAFMRIGASVAGVAALAACVPTSPSAQPGEGGAFVEQSQGRGGQEAGGSGG